MKSTADYPIRFAWAARVFAAADSFGEKGETFPSSTFRWGNVEDATAGEEEFNKSDQAKHRATITLRGYVAVQPGDRLTCTRWGAVEVWEVRAMKREEFETVCEVESPS